MLVLSRKQNQRIVFPNLGINVEIMRIKGNAVRVGVDAPVDVKVLRDEIIENEGSSDSDENQTATRHELRNRLNTASLALHLLQKQLDAGNHQAAEDTLTHAINEFTNLDKALAARTKTPAEPDQPSKHRVLLVEDNDNERELLAGFLRMSGYRVDTVEDGLEAMNWLSKNEKPDAVLLDMQMPRLDGRKTISAIRRNPIHEGLKVFAVSGSDRRTVDVSVGERGVDHWFSKPLRPSEFVEKLDSQLTRSCGRPRSPR